MKLRVLMALVAALLTALVVAPSGEASGGTSDVFRDIPVSGKAAQGGTFQGVLEIQRFAVEQRRLVAKGLLDGRLRDSSGNVRQVTDQAVTVPIAQLRGTCRILHLVLAPLDLDLLGLEVHLSRVVLDIVARRGPGRLLGNLLCAIAHLLDQPPRLAGVANRLNQALRISQTITNTPVAGTLANTLALTGNLDITGFTTQNGSLVAQGLLSGVVRDPTGAAVRTITNAPVQIPIAQVRATCRILHLVLGPLDLDLLGLEIHLNRVVLDIVARRGPGRLLGNLLCAIAHLLDRRPPLVGPAANRLNGLVLMRQ
jgi:hypothetical protein